MPPAPTLALDAPESHGLPALTPDTVEQEKGDGIDDIVPAAGYTKLPVVGLNGSAGGLAAWQAFFGATNFFRDRESFAALEAAIPMVE